MIFTPFLNSTAPVCLVVGGPEHDQVVEEGDWEGVEDGGHRPGGGGEGQGDNRDTQHRNTKSYKGKQ